MMPQCTFRRRDEPYGKGSLHADLLEVTFRTRRRAARINEGEKSKHNAYTKILQKHHAVEEERETRVWKLLPKILSIDLQVCSPKQKKNIHLSANILPLMNC